MRRIAIVPVLAVGGVFLLAGCSATTPEPTPTTAPTQTPEISADVAKEQCVTAWTPDESDPLTDPVARDDFMKRYGADKATATWDDAEQAWHITLQPKFVQEADANFFCVVTAHMVAKLDPTREAWPATPVTQQATPMS